MARRFNTVTRQWEETGGVFIKDKRIDPVSDAPISDDRFSRFKQRLGDVVSENTPRFIDDPSQAKMGAMSNAEEERGIEPRVTSLGVERPGETRLPRSFVQPEAAGQTRRTEGEQKRQGETLVIVKWDFDWK